MVPPPDRCEQTSWHSAQKHEFLKAYYRIWTENVGKKPGSTAPTLAIADLFASYGWCYSKDNKKTWPGTAALSAQCLKDYGTKFGKRLLLNSFSLNPAKQDHQVSALKANLAELQLGPSVELKISSEPLDRAIHTAKTFIDPQWPNLWILDPYEIDDLPWPRVEEILSHSGDYERGGVRKLRRPELFITLHTHALQRNIREHPELMSGALGQPVEEWGPRFDELTAKGLNVREAVAQLYAARLEAFYGKPPIVLPVPGTAGNVVYLVFFCTEHDAAFYMMLKKGLPEYEKWRQTKWRGPAKEEARSKRVDRTAAESGHRQTRIGEE